MSRDFENILDECLMMLDRGESVEACLERFPEFANELKPILEMARPLRSVEMPQSSSAAAVRSRNLMLAAVDRKFSKQAVSVSPLVRYTERLIKWITGKENIDMKLVTRLAFTFLFVILLVGAAGTAIASAKTIPGDALYPVKTMIDRVRYTLTLDPLARETLQERIQERRTEEIRQAIEEGRLVKVNFSGELLVMDEDSWLIGEFEVLINEETVIHGEPSVGVMVEVKGALQPDGSIVALVLNVVNHNGMLSPYPPAENKEGMPMDKPAEKINEKHDDEHEPKMIQTEKATEGVMDGDDDQQKPTEKPTMKPDNTCEPTATMKSTGERETEMPKDGDDDKMEETKMPKMTYTCTPTPQASMQPISTPTTQPTATATEKMDDKHDNTSTPDPSMPPDPTRDSGDKHDGGH